MHNESIYRIFKIMYTLVLRKKYKSDTNEELYGMLTEIINGKVIVERPSSLISDFVDFRTKKIIPAVYRCVPRKRTDK